MLERLGWNVHHDLAEHLDEPPVGVEREPDVPTGLLGQTLHRLVAQPEVQDRVHHPRHRELRSRTDRDEQRVVRVAEGLAHRLLEPSQVLAHLLQHLWGRAPFAEERQTRLGRDGEAGRDRQAHVRHLGEVGALTAEQVLHVPVAFGEVVDVLGHRSASGRDPHQSTEGPRPPSHGPASGEEIATAEESGLGPRLDPDEGRGDAEAALHVVVVAREQRLVGEVEPSRASVREVDVARDQELAGAEGGKDGTVRGTQDGGGTSVEPFDRTQRGVRTASRSAVVHWSRSAANATSICSAGAPSVARPISSRMLRVVWTKMPSTRAESVPRADATPSAGRWELRAEGLGRSDPHASTDLRPPRMREGRARRRRARTRP